MAALGRPRSIPHRRTLRWNGSLWDGLRAMVARPKGEQPAQSVLYLHGGGYCIGGPSTHKGLVTHLAVAADVSVYVPDYRLAPEHPHPAALEDGLSAYRWMLDHQLSPEANLDCRGLRWRWVGARDGACHSRRRLAATRGGRADLAVDRPELRLGVARSQREDRPDDPHQLEPAMCCSLPRWPTHG